MGPLQGSIAWISLAPSAAALIVSPSKLVGMTRIRVQGLVGVLCCCLVLGLVPGYRCNAAADQDRQHRPGRKQLGDAEPLMVQHYMQQEQTHLAQLRHAALSSSWSAQQLQHKRFQHAFAAQQQQVEAAAVERRLLQFKPSSREQEASKKHAGRMSVWHAFGVTVLCLAAMGILGCIGYQAMQWYQRTRRPGYVELQAIDTAYHRPWVTL